MRIFLDANILFSAAKSAGAVDALLRLLVKQKHTLCVDEYVVVEARRNLLAKADQDAIKRLDSLLMKIEVSLARIAARQNAIALDIAWLADKDQPVLAAAIQMGCGALVTGDTTHFGKGFGKSFSGVTLYSPRMLFDVVSQART